MKTLLNDCFVSMQNIIVCLKLNDDDNDNDVRVRRNDCFTND